MYASDGSTNVIASPGNIPVGAYHPCGALYYTLVDGTSFVGLRALDGSLNLVDVAEGDDTRFGEYHPSGAIRAFGLAFNPLSTDPLAWWKLDDGSGSTAADSSGNNYIMTLINSPTWLSDGLRFAAASSQKGHADDPEMLGVLSGASAVTVSFLARASSYSDVQPAFAMDNNGSGTASLLLYPYDNANGDGFRSYLHTGVADFGIDQNTGAANVNVYNNYIFIQRSATDREQYVNNVSVGTSSGSSNLPTGLTSVTLGAWDGGQFANVDLKQVIIIDRAVTDTERAALAAYNP